MPAGPRSRHKHGSTIHTASLPSTPTNPIPKERQIPKTRPPATLILPPPMATGHALVEARHGLVGTADLDLEEGGLVAVAAVGRALHAALLRIVPGAGPAEDVLLLLALVDAPREDGLGDGVLEGAGAAFEAVGAHVGEGDGEDVGAVRAD
ncbi:hypothetical protein TOPH_05486 [Tolypocladium ophioglossoides CBS 100239]|uniref:Uncharacterized protein n=1 Tax=Tolypocladium ophioglossoides (strain CBS 100239) TaxID=1163406 RepID=A0A0L0N766_TOLOC|nr:hypothetical protein TOPH_05486 [Tolypocladium ophioglossoides CBS 100239]